MSTQQLFLFFLYSLYCLLCFLTQLDLSIPWGLLLFCNFLFSDDDIKDNNSKKEPEGREERVTQGGRGGEDMEEVTRLQNPCVSCVLVEVKDLDLRGTK